MLMIREVKQKMKVHEIETENAKFVMAGVKQKTSKGASTPSKSVING
jgi:hypothetical protein